jgi:hypothetical protein
MKHKKGAMDTINQETIMEEQKTKEQGGLLIFAEQELARIPKDDEGMQERINKHILDMITVFCEEGHSGFTANYTVNILNRLLRCLPLTPIEDTPEDWNDVGGGFYQHRRCSTVFKHKDHFGGKAYILDAKVYSDDGGKTWFTNSDSREVIAFPYEVPAVRKRYLIDESRNIVSEYTGK